MSVGGFLFGMVIWADCFVLLELGFLGRMVGAGVVVEFVVMGAVMWCKQEFFYFFRRGCFGGIMGVRVVIGVVVGVMVLVCVVVKS